MQPYSVARQDLTVLLRYARKFTAPRTRGHGQDPAGERAQCGHQTHQQDGTGQPEQ
jgi:hypothetical protein